MKKKITIIVVLLLTAVLLFFGVKYGIPALREYQAQKAEEERLSQPAYYTEYHLTSHEFQVMIRYFGVETTPKASAFTDYDAEEWPDFSYYVMEPTEYTEKLIVVLNYNLFLEPTTEYDIAAAELAHEYGFSEDNPITVEWVMENPIEAIVILQKAECLSTYYFPRSNVEAKYNEIMGIEDIEETNATESGAE